MAGFLPDDAVETLRDIARGGMTARARVRRTVTTIGAGGAHVTATVDVTAEVFAREAAAGTITADGVPCGIRAEQAPGPAIVADAPTAAGGLLVTFDPRGFALAADSVRRGDRLVVRHALPGVPSPIDLAVVGDVPGGVNEVVRRVRVERPSAPLAPVAPTTAAG